MIGGAHAGGDPQQATVFAPALPDQPGATDLGERGQNEEQGGTGDGHVRTVPVPRPTSRNCRMPWVTDQTGGRITAFAKAARNSGG